MKYQGVKIEQDAEKPVEKVVLAAAILKISEAMEDLRKSGLNEDAIIVLVRDRTGIAKGTLKAVFSALASLRRDYASPPRLTR
jgi:hypothetical protein